MSSPGARGGLADGGSCQRLRRATRSTGTTGDELVDDGTTRITGVVDTSAVEEVSESYLVDTTTSRT